MGGRQAKTGLASLGSADTRRAFQDFGGKRRGEGAAKPKLASLRWEARTRAERFKTSEGSRGGRGAPSQNWPRFAGKRGHAPSASRFRREAEGGRQAQSGLASLGSADTRRALQDFGGKQRVGEGAPSPNWPRFAGKRGHAP